jgi:hypothetical protein
MHIYFIIPKNNFFISCYDNNLLDENKMLAKCVTSKYMKTYITMFYSSSAPYNEVIAALIRKGNIYTFPSKAFCLSQIVALAF